MEMNLSNKLLLKIGLLFTAGKIVMMVKIYMKMKKKTLRKLLKAQRKERAQAQAPGLPWAMKKYFDRYFWQNIADFACSPREFHWRQLRKAAEARRRRAG